MGSKKLALRGGWRRAPDRDHALGLPGPGWRRRALRPGRARRAARLPLVLAARRTLQRRECDPAAAALARRDRVAHDATATRHHLLPADHPPSGLGRGGSGRARPALERPRDPRRRPRIPEVAVLG